MVNQQGIWKEGYVALIDILGFTEGIQEDNISAFFRKYNKSVQDVMLKFRDEGIEYIVFSDIIVIYTQNANQKSFLAITRACSLLFTSLLNIGLPLRGCLSYGKFHLQKTPNGVILAGKPFIDAYNYERKQNWIGIMISPKLIQKIPSLQEPEKLMKYIVINKSMQIPLHDEFDEKYEGFVILPSEHIKPKKETIVKDIRKTIKMLQNKKTIAPDTISQKKYSNTIDWLTNCINEIAGSGGPESPDICIINRTNYAETQDEQWKIPIAIFNKRDVPGENIDVFYEILNTECCDVINFEGFENVSHINPGKTIFSNSLTRPLLKGANIALGKLIVKMKDNKRSLKVRSSIVARNMKEHRCDTNFYITRNTIKLAKEEDIYI